MLEQQLEQLQLQTSPMVRSNSQVQFMDQSSGETFVKPWQISAIIIQTTLLEEEHLSKMGLVIKQIQL